MTWRRLAPVLLAPILLAQAPAPDTGAPPAAAPTPAPWLPRGMADLTVLDKVTARLLPPLDVKVGDPATVGPLVILVRGCYVRPPDVAADATAFLDVTDTTQGAPEFHGWLVLSAPAVSGMQHPVYDVRLVGCR